MVAVYFPREDNDVLVSIDTSNYISRPQREEWQDLAECAQIGSEVFFPPPGGPYNKAQEICDSCSVSNECLIYIMRLEGSSGLHGRSGMFGGLTPSQRWHLYKLRNPEESDSQELQGL